MDPATTTETAQTVYFNAFDLLVIFIVSLSAVLAYYRGFMRELFGLLNWVGAAYLAVAMAPALSKSMRPYFTSPDLPLYFAIGIGFVLSFIVLALLNVRLTKFARSENLEATDQRLGALFGILRGYILLALAYLMFSIPVPPERRPDWLMGAVTHNMLHTGARGIAELFPDIEAFDPIREEAEGAHLPADRTDGREETDDAPYYAPIERRDPEWYDRNL